MSLEYLKTKVVFKRPKVGYATEKERVFASWSGVSSYDIFYEGAYVGFAYADQFYNEPCWSYQIDVPNLKEKGRVERLKDVRDEVKRILDRIITKEFLADLRALKREDNIDENGWRTDE